MSAANRLDAPLIAAARKHPALFASLVLRDEDTGGPITMAPIHQTMHDAWTKHRRFVLLGAPGIGKTAQLVARLVWELGHDMSARIGVESSVKDQSEKIVDGIAHVIESPECRAVFPKLRPGSTWRRDALVLAKRGWFSRDLSAVALAFGSTAFAGARFTHFIGDDLLSDEDFRTQHGRDTAWANWTRMVGRQGFLTRIWLSGNVLSADDVLHRCEQADWPTLRIPIVDDDGNSNWSARFPQPTITALQQQVSNPREWARSYLCKALAEAAEFSSEALQAAVERGRELPPVFYNTVDGKRILGVDTALNRGRDKTAFVLVSTHPDGTRICWDAWEGHWSTDQISALVIDICQRNKATAIIEDASNGPNVFDNVRKVVPARKFPTGATNKDARLDWFGAELESRRWAFRTMAPTVKTLVEHLGAYDRDRHQPDLVSALMMCIEGIRSVPNAQRVRSGNIYTMIPGFRRVL